MPLFTLIEGGGVPLSSQTRRQIYLPPNPSSGGGGGGGEVDRERLIREGLEPFPTPVESSLLMARILQDEVFPALTEETIVAAALIANEIFPVVLDTSLFIAGLSEVAPVPVDAATIRAAISELSPNPVDAARISAHIFETPVPPVDSVSLRTGVSETVPGGIDAATIGVSVPDVVPNPIDSQGISTYISEVVPALTETTPLSVSTTALESMPSPTDAVTAIVAASSELFVPPLDNDGRLSVAGIRPANVVVSNTGFTNPNNVLDHDADEATVVATATGIGGTTAATANFDMIVSFADFALTWLDDITQAILNPKIRIATGGVALGATQNVILEFSLNDGASWTGYWTQTAQTAGLEPNQDLLATPAFVGDDWTKLNQLRLRIRGSITSGTGLGATNTLAVQWVVLHHAAQKTLT